MTKTKDFTIRITWADWKRLRRYIRAYPGESVAHYFERVVDRIGYEVLEKDDRT